MSKKPSTVQMEIWYQKYEENIKSGLDENDAGRFVSARKKLLIAAEMLYLLADGVGSGRIREQRITQAEEILAMAENLPKQDKSRLTADGVESRKDNDALFSQVDGAKLESIPGFAEIAGLDEVKEEINLCMIAPFEYPDIAKKHGLQSGGGLLMYGPPGTGKTMIARATAKELKAAFFTIKVSDIVSKWVGESESNVDELFATARKHERSVIFIDEIEGLTPSRDSEENSAVMKRLVSQFLAELDGFDSDSQNPLLFIGATNYPWKIDSAMLRPGRFDAKVYVGLPDAEARRFMLEQGFGSKNLGDDVSIGYLVEQTEGYSGADIKSFIKYTSREGFKKEILDKGDVKYNAELIKATLEKVRPSVSKEMLDKYYKWERGD